MTRKELGSLCSGASQKASCRSFASTPNYPELHCMAFLPFFSLVIPFQEIWRKEAGQNVDSHHCNRHNTCYCDSDPIKITLTLMFLCMLVEEKAQLAPFPLSHPVFASLKLFAPADWITLPALWVCHKCCFAFAALNRSFCHCCTCGGTERSDQPHTHIAQG